MAKGRTLLKYPLGNNNPAEINDLIMQWVNANHLELTEKNGEQFYLQKSMGGMGSYAFSYQIANGLIQICVWLSTLAGDEQIDSGLYGWGNKMSANSALKPLLDEISRRTGTVQEPANTGTYTTQNQTQNTNQNINQYSNQNINQNQTQYTNPDYTEKAPSGFKFVIITTIVLAVFSILIKILTGDSLARKYPVFIIVILASTIGLKFKNTKKLSIASIVLGILSYIV